MHVWVGRGGQKKKGLHRRSAFTTSKKKKQCVCVCMLEAGAGAHSARTHSMPSIHSTHARTHAHTFGTLLLKAEAGGYAPGPHPCDPAAVAILNEIKAPTPIFWYTSWSSDGFAGVAPPLHCAMLTTVGLHANGVDHCAVYLGVTSLSELQPHSGQWSYIQVACFLPTPESGHTDGGCRTLGYGL